MKKMILFFVFGVLIFPAVVFAGGPDMQDGLWEITMTMEMPGMPADMPFAGQPIKMTHCYTKKDIEDSKNTVPQSDENCKITSYKLSANKAAWAVECKGKDGDMSGTGEIFYKGNNYEAAIKMQIKDGKDTMQMMQRIKAHRIGDCK